MPDVDCARIRRQLSMFPNSKVGFIVYRLAYKDDAQWQRFMDHLNTRVRLNLEGTGDGDIFEHVDWDVQEDPSLQDASIDEVRQRFQSYLQENSANIHGVRVFACVAVLQLHHDQILLKSPKPQEFDSMGRGFVDVISIEQEEGDQAVGLSFLFPRVYSLVDGAGWNSIRTGREDVFAI